MFLFRIIWNLPEGWRQRDLVWINLKKLAILNMAVTFINIGANDGLSGDPLIEFIFKYHWRGLLIEPVPYVFKRLQKVYKNQKQVNCVNVALAEKLGKRNFYYLDDSRDLLPGSDQIGSFDKKHVLKHEYMFSSIAKYLKTEVVETVTLHDLQQKYNLNNIDVYLIDTEGYDYEILKLIDFSQHKPLLIIYEHQHLSPKDRLSSEQLLIKNSYLIRREGGNTVASLES